MPEISPVDAVTARPEGRPVALYVIGLPSGSMAASVNDTALPSAVVWFAGCVNVGARFTGVLAVVTVTGDDVAELPALSLATAVNTWPPSGTAVVFHVTEKGDDVSSAPRLAPSSKNCTPAIPPASDAVADTVTFDPDTVALLAGAESVTVGGVVSLLGVV